MSTAASASASVAQQADGTLLISGELDFITVPVLTREVTALLQQSAAVSTAVTVDCALVDRTNSAGLALLLEMSRIMRANDRSIQFQNLPRQMQTMAHAYGLIEHGQQLEAVLQN